MSPIVAAVVLGLWAYIGFYDALGPNFIQAYRPLMAGTVAGLFVGNVGMGMMIGGTLELTALGVYTYGGATIPDYQSGAILGTYFAVQTNSFTTGLALAIPAALLLTQVDILNRFLNFVFVHRADAYAQANNPKGFERMMVLYSHIIWGLSRGLPVFLAVAFGSPLVKAVSDFFNNYGWINNGIKAVGGIIPALGFAMLLKIMPVNKYPAALILGFVMFAYLKIPLLGIAIAAIAIALIFQSLKYQRQEA
ncbi:MAG TPA: PTS sugar transporter subunit IIC [Anaerolineales bacterium]|nr:PTS sugar transporter subunit IIC [Anaerolineales bacterium]